MHSMRRHQTWGNTCLRMCRNDRLRLLHDSRRRLKFVPREPRKNFRIKHRHCVALLVNLWVVLAWLMEALLPGLIKREKKEAQLLSVGSARYCLAKGLFG